MGIISQQSSYNVIRATEKCWIKCVSVAGDYVEKWQNTMHISPGQLRQAMNFLNSGVAGPLAAQDGGQICRPFVLLGRPFAAKDPT